MSDEMRVLTVRQPWAWAIIHGGKDVENRVRNIAGSYRGLVAIHAGLAAFEQHNLASQVHRDNHDGRTDTRIHFGGILGVVDLVDVHPARSQCCSSRWAEHTDGDLHHLVMLAPQALRRPIPYKGALGLRHLEHTVIDQILKELA